MREQLEQRVAELTAEVEQIVAQLAQLKQNPPETVAAAQVSVTAAIDKLRTAKSAPTTWHSRTSDANRQMREFWTLEQAVQSARRDRLIVGRTYDGEVAALQRKLYEVRKWLATAIELQQTGGTFLLAI
jgi:hypothetical protein